jgi:hypothetical protein
MFTMRPNINMVIFVNKSNYNKGRKHTSIEKGRAGAFTKRLGAQGPTTPWLPVLDGGEAEPGERAAGEAGGGGGGAWEAGSGGGGSGGRNKTGPPDPARTWPLIWLCRATAHGVAGPRRDLRRDTAAP